MTMSIRDAAYHTVHDYPGGVAELASRLGKHVTTLNHEVRPPVHSSAKLGLLDAAKVMDFADDNRILDALAAARGCMVVPLPRLAVEDGASFEHVARIAREFAEFMAEVATDMADGRISDNELARIEREFGELVATGQRLLAHCQALNAAGKPAAALARVA